MQSLTEAVGTLRVHLEAGPIVLEAIKDLITLAERQHLALKFYAASANYLDGVPSHLDEEGLLTIADEGYTAKIALGENRPLSAPLVRWEPTDGNDPQSRS